MTANQMNKDRYLTEVPSVRVGMLIHAEPARVFEAIVDPRITSKVWYTKSTGRMVEGAALRWTWEMYGVSSDVQVQEVEPERRVRFTWSGYRPENPSTVEFLLTAFEESTYLTITETGFTGTPDELVRFAVDSTGGFTFLISALKALLEHDIALSLVGDAHPSGVSV
jgi:uncharacterized protein YndB with AHSA1/START domain